MLVVGRIAIAEPPVPFRRLQQSLQWHSYRTRDPGLAWVRAQIQEAAALFGAFLENAEHGGTGSRERLCAAAFSGRRRPRKVQKGAVWLAQKRFSVQRRESRQSGLSGR